MDNPDEKKVKVGIFTGGGDAPGLNAAIEGIVTMCAALGWQVFGFLDGWAGVIQKRYIELTLASVAGIKEKGGTVIFTSRTPIFPKKEGQSSKSAEVIASLKELGIEILFVMGGEDTNGEGWKLYIEHGIMVIGLPKTIDRDLCGTDYTMGYLTAIHIIAELVRKLHTTAQSHHRVMFVEAMGRHAGWMALEGGLGGNAHGIWTPEMNTYVPIMELFEKIIRKRYSSPNPADHYAIFVVAEGSADEAMIEYLSRLYRQAEEILKTGGMAANDIRKFVPKGLFDAFGHVNLGKIGVAKQVAAEIQEKLGAELTKTLQVPFECREVVLGHLQRAGAPVAADVCLAYRFGVHAVELALERKFGVMIAVKGDAITEVSLEDALGKLNLVPEYRWREVVRYMESQC